MSVMTFDKTTIELQRIADSSKGNFTSEQWGSIEDFANSMKQRLGSEISPIPFGEFYAHDDYEIDRGLNGFNSHDQSYTKFQDTFDPANPDATVSPSSSSRVCFCFSDCVFFGLCVV